MQSCRNAQSVPFRRTSLQAMRNILVISLGAAPQVATETLWALAIDPERPAAERFVPDEMFVVTTAAGYAKARPALFEPGDKITAFCREFALHRFPVRPIVVGSDGAAFDDLRSLEANFLFADAVIGLIRDLSRDDNTRLHVSLAGGRKTMSFFAGLAPVLLGRRQDRLSHVLVSSFFENCPDFWWPNDPPRLVTHRHTGEQRSTAAAKIDLVDVPFLRLRSYLPEISSYGGYREWVATIQDALDQPVGVLDDASQTLTVAGYQVRITEPQQYALYRLLFETAIEQRPGAGPDGVGAEHFGWMRPKSDFATARSPGMVRFVENLTQVWRKRRPTGADERVASFLESIAGWDPLEPLSSKRSRVVERFRPLDARLREQFQPLSRGRGETLRWGILASADRLAITDGSGSRQPGG